MEKIKRFQYLHRDGDVNMTFAQLVKREISEMLQEIRLAHKKMGYCNSIPFVKCIIKYHFAMFFKPKFTKKIIKIKLKQNKKLTKIMVRNNQSDLYILRENFISNIYDFDFERYTNVNVIVDLGANIGLSSLFFQTKFPYAKIFCVEPVSDNIHMLHMNCKLNYFKWKIIRGAIQEKDGFIELYPNQWWSSSTTTKKVALKRQTNKGRLEKILKLPIEKVNGLSISTLMKKFNIDRIDILKMDIEGAEEEVILHSDEWIDKINVLIIEIHQKYVNRERIENKLNKAGLFRIENREGPTDVFVRR